MKSVLKYPGAKNRLAPWIVSMIPPHEVYLEPYAGSLAVLFNKEPCHIETINDINSDVINFFEILRERPGELIEKISLTPYSREEYDRSYESTDDKLEKARRYCVRCWQGFGCANLYHNGFKSGQQKTSPNPARGWAELSDTLYLAAKRLKQVQIENLDAIELINRYNTKDVFIYADPPYLLSTRKGYLYKYEMKERDHIELLDTLLNHPGKVLLSGYENDLYNSKLVGWHKEQKNTLAEGGQKRIETLWMNYNPYSQIDIFDLLTD